MFIETFYVLGIMIGLGDKVRWLLQIIDFMLVIGLVIQRKDMSYVVIFFQVVVCNWKVCVCYAWLIFDLGRIEYFGIQVFNDFDEFFYVVINFLKFYFGGKEFISDCYNFGVDFIFIVIVYFLFIVWKIIFINFFGIFYLEMIIWLIFVY